MLNVLQDPSLYHGDPPVDPRFPPPLRPAASPVVLAPSGGNPPIDTGAPQEAATAPTYDDLTVAELRDLMREYGLPYAKLSKAELVAALSAYDEA